jgi:hypothetical protein
VLVVAEVLSQRWCQSRPLTKHMATQSIMATKVTQAGADYRVTTIG